MILYVTRHGETDYNVAGRYAGSTDVSLNEAGFAQAKELAKQLMGIRFDAVISSSMLRARQTADIVCASLNMQYKACEQFVERNIGVFEGLTRDEARKKYPELWNRQCTSKPDDAPYGGETLRQACGRIDSGVLQLRQKYEGKTVLLICHAFVARAVNRYCRNLSYDEMSSFILNNCGIVKYGLE